MQVRKAKAAGKQANEQMTYEQLRQTELAKKPSSGQATLKGRKMRLQSANLRHQKQPSKKRRLGKEFDEETLQRDLHIDLIKH